MKKLLTLALTATLLNTAAHALAPKDFSRQFKNYHACFILYSLNEHKVVSEYNPKNYCNTRLAADSTFKIPLSLMAFSQELINENTVFKWDGKPREMPEWNQNQTPQTWLKYSTVWVSQQLTPQLGEERIKQYLAGFNYGNQDFSGDPGQNNGLGYAWLSSSLKISAREQLDFLVGMLSDQLPVTEEAVENTRKNLYLGTLANGADYYGKTGSGRHGNNEREANPSKLHDGWFVGFVENGEQQYVFVSNLSDKRAPAATDSYGSQVLKPKTLALLNEYFSNSKHA